MLALILFGLFCIFLLCTNPILIVVLVVFAVVGMILSGNGEREEREKREREEAEQARIDKENKLLDFYLLCRRKGLKDPIAHPEEHDSLLIIGKNSDFGDDLQVCLDAYQKGAQIHRQREHERRERRKERAAQKERDEAAEQKHLADLVGKDKYLDTVEQQLKEYNAAAKTGDFLLQAASADLMARPRKEDWAVAGGFADAIAGPGAALATVSEIQARNARAEQEAAERRQRAHENMKTAVSVKCEAEARYKKLKTQRDAVAKKMVDDTNPEEKFLMLVPQIQDKSVTASGNIKVKLTVKLEGTPTLFNKPAVLDGSLKISALQDGREIGAGYYSPTGFGKTDLSRVGFGKSPAKNVLVLINPQTPLDKSLPYDLHIEPYHLWVIEK